MKKRLIALLLLITICMLSNTGCRQLVIYEYELSGVISSVSGDVITVQTVKEYCPDDEYKYWFGDKDCYFIAGVDYNWNAVYVKENSSIELTVSKDWLKSNSLKEYADISEDRMINFTIKNNIVTEIEITDIYIAYEQEFRNDFQGEFFPGRYYTLESKDDFYTLKWEVYPTYYNIRITNSDDTQEYDYNIIGIESGRLCLIDNNSDGMELWFDGVTEALHISIQDEVVVTAYKDTIGSSNGKLGNELMEEADSNVKIVDLKNNEYMTIHYK